MTGPDIRGRARYRQAALGLFLAGYLLAVAAEGCEGCRVQSSPSFHYAAVTLLVHLPWYLVNLLAWARPGRDKDPERRGRQEARARATAIAGLSLAGFLLVYGFEALCWKLIHASLAQGWEPTLYQINRALLVTSFLVIAARRIPERSARLTRRLSGGLWVLSPAAGLPGMAFILLLAPATPGALALPSAITMGSIWIGSAAWLLGPGPISADPD